MDYLLKPIEPKELIAAVLRVKQQKRMPAAEQFEILFSRIQNKESAFHKLALPTLEGYELIMAESIIRCAADNYTHFF